MSHVTAISYGGGVQTVALAILAAQGKITRPDVILFADTGGERQATYEYNAMMGAWLVERDLVMETNMAGPSLTDALNAGRAVIPFYGSHGGMLPRVCTERWKIRVIRKALRARRATTATVMLGISRDEIHRMRDSDVKWATNTFPLIDLGMTRRDCERTIEAAGLPQPPKSACVYCPHRSLSGWKQLRRDDPAAFAEAVRIESTFDGLYLHAGRKPLPLLVEEVALEGELFEEDGCTAGHCFV